MANKDAVKQVLQIKKQYDELSKKDANFNKSDQAKQLNQQAQQIRSSNNIDDSKYGSGATLAQAYTNYYKEFGGSNKSPNANVVNPPQEGTKPIETDYKASKYDREVLDMIKSLPSQMLGYDEANKMANDQLGYQYDKALTDTLKNIDRQSLQSGFFGQLPTVDYKQRNADDIERSRAAGIAQLSNQLVSESKNDVNNSIAKMLQYSGIQSDKENQAWQKAYQERQYVDSRSDVDWDKLFKERQYGDSRSDADWQKGVTESQLTGIFQGKPTMAFTELGHKMNMDTKQLEMSEQKLNHDIQMSWENLKNDKISLGQAAQRIGLQSQAQAMDYTKFMAGLKETAFGMAADTFGLTATTGSNGEMSFMMDNVNGGGKTQISTGDVMDMMDTYTKILLGEISADDLYEFESRYLTNSGYDGRTK